MAFRLWLRLTRAFVALSVASERISAAIKDHRNPPKAPTSPGS